MTFKTIRIDTEAYERLQAARRQGESFSQVIKRVVNKPVDVQQFLEEISRRPLREEATAVIESHLHRRRRASRRKRQARHGLKPILHESD
ncbi:MAG: antitoxin VapB family protein [Planctomycetes bacterium]|jgi:predicted CopG family antitoxin|nr:antitoxin VapB family protein [Planctomycetota bacterium]